MCLAVEINMLNYTVIRCVRGHCCVKFTTLRQELQKSNLAAHSIRNSVTIVT